MACPPVQEWLGALPNGDKSEVEAAGQQDVVRVWVEEIVWDVSEEVWSQRDVSLVIKEVRKILEDDDVGIEVGHSFGTLVEKGLKKRGLYACCKLENVVAAESGLGVK